MGHDCGACDGRLVAAAGAILLLLNLRGGRYCLYPFTLFSTWVHEISHGIAALFVGGRLNSLQVFRDGSGLASFRCSGRLRHAFVASAGYLGTAVVGAAMLLSRRSADTGLVGLGCTGGLILLSVVLLVRNLFGALALIVVGFSLVAAGLGLPPATSAALYTFMAATCCLNAVTSVRELFGRGAVVVGGRPMLTDAQKVADLLGLPYWFWATLWLATSLLLVAVGVRYGG